jgi:hypothetical protein
MFGSLINSLSIFHFKVSMSTTGSQPLKRGQGIDMNQLASKKHRAIQSMTSLVE